MSLIDALDRIAAIQSEIAPLLGGTPATASSAATASTATTPTATAASTATSPSFATLLSQAQGVPSNTAALPTAATLPTAAATTTLPVATQLGAATGGAGIVGAGATLPGASLLTSGQQQFGAELAAQTGLDPGVVSAWMLAEESSGAAGSRQSANNHDWLNIGYTDSGTYGAQASVWSNPVTAADATAGWLKGQDTIPGYGTAAPGVQAILSTAGQPPATQIAALQNSGWASSGYPDVPQLYQQVTGSAAAAVAPVAAPVTAAPLAATAPVATATAAA